MRQLSQRSRAPLCLTKIAPMGACMCRSLTEITDDPSVVLYTDVRLSAVRNDQGFAIFGSRNGFMYVKDDQLCLENLFGNRLYCKCYKRAWDLSVIADIQLLTEDVMVLYRVQNGTRLVNLCFNAQSPGIKIVLRQDLITPDMFNRLGTDVILSIQDATGIHAELSQALSNYLQRQ